MSKQCKDKMKNLKQYYIWDGHNRSGHNRSNWPYYNLMDDVLGDRQSTRPATSQPTNVSDWWHEINCFHTFSSHFLHPHCGGSSKGLRTTTEWMIVQKYFRPAWISSTFTYFHTCSCDSVWWWWRVGLGSMTSRLTSTCRNFKHKWFTFYPSVLLQVADTLRWGGITLLWGVLQMTFATDVQHYRIVLQLPPSDF